MPLKSIKTFTVKHLCVLDKDGRVDKELEPDLKDSELLLLHRYMTLSRMMDARMLSLQRQGRLGTLPVCRGQEAAFCPPILALEDTDWFVGSYRELGARLMRGEPLKNALLFYNGYEEGNVNPENDRTLPVSIILGSQLSHAVGLAHGASLLGEKNTVAMTMFGDGASSEGDFHEALNFAGVLNAPVVFICQNNQFAISTPREIQTRAGTIAQKAIGYGIPGIQVDGNDALAMYRAAKEAVDRARSGRGPSLIEAVTFRMGMHTTADDPSRYRDQDLVDDWAKKDPLIRFKSYLAARGIWDENRQAEMEGELKAEIDITVKDFESKGPGVLPDSPFDFIFGTRVQAVEDQRTEFLADLSDSRLKKKGGGYG